MVFGVIVAGNVCEIQKSWLVKSWVKILLLFVLSQNFVCISEKSKFTDVLTKALPEEGRKKHFAYCMYIARRLGLDPIKLILVGQIAGSTVCIFNQLKPVCQLAHEEGHSVKSNVIYVQCFVIFVCFVARLSRFSADNKTHFLLVTEYQVICIFVNSVVVNIEVHVVKYVSARDTVSEKEVEVSKVKK